jgi:hypothetical protein
VLAAAHARGVSIRYLARAEGRSPTRVHQLVAAALGELRSWAGRRPRTWTRTLSWGGAQRSRIASVTSWAGCAAAP